MGEGDFCGKVSGGDPMDRDWYRACNGEDPSVDWNDPQLLPKVWEEIDTSYADRMVRLNYESRSEVLKPSTNVAILMAEDCGWRHIAIIVDEREANYIDVGRKHFPVPRPFTHDLMLEALAQAGVRIEHAVIYRVHEGVFYAFLTLKRQDGSLYRIDSRTTDAISLSVRGGFPVYMLENVFETEQLHSQNGTVVTLEIGQLDTPLLKKLLEEAVNKEEFEKASLLRDEIRRRTPH